MWCEGYYRVLLRRFWCTGQSLRIHVATQVSFDFGRQVANESFYGAGSSYLQRDYIAHVITSFSLFLRIIIGFECHFWYITKSVTSMQGFVAWTLAIWDDILHAAVMSVVFTVFPNFLSSWCSKKEHSYWNHQFFWWTLPLSFGRRLEQFWHRVRCHLHVS